MTHFDSGRWGRFARAPLAIATLAVAIVARQMPSIAEGQSQYAVQAPVLRASDNQLIAATEFPKPLTESRFWACLVSVDCINRCGVLRLEERDRLINFSMLPYGTIYYRGAPASLGDIPPGTMVECWGFGDEATSLHRNVLCVRDDVSVQTFYGCGYRIDSIDPSQRSFVATRQSVATASSQRYQPVETMRDGASEPKIDESIAFQYDDATDWYVGDRVANAGDLAVGQVIRANFIRRFYPGPPLITRCTEVWLDEASQRLASDHQLDAFACYARDRGYPLRVDRVDDANRIVVVSLLETGLMGLIDRWKVGDAFDFSASTSSLRMWEPNGGQGGPDRMFSVQLKQVDVQPVGYGAGGAELTFAVPMLYEAYRPGTILKLYPRDHPVPILPMEERMPKEYDTFLRP
jgi:hypothetical protein